MALHFYAQRKAVKDGSAITPANYSYTSRDEAERQYHLLCAAAIANSDGYDLASVEYGTIEQGAIERKYWNHETEPEQEPVEEPEA